MYLKRLELQGFKSFPEKIKLEFNTGITAVVGPNGSGKSNISDAIRWVLGEQRAKSLRGSKMEDIIFAGTQNRRPLSFAEVTMVLDNEDKRINLDYSEITITRRVYRTGESEYQLNGTTCRLKDIHELFMDTGIGREGYSIIGQGKIDEILSAKSDDRRNLFEEAAGIVKYKNRKEDAENKLEKEKNNLIRVNDIIIELESQLEPLLRQSEKAKQYLELKEKLKSAQINIFLNEVETSEINLKTLKTQIENTESEINDKSLGLQNVIKSLDTLKLSVLDFDHKNNELTNILINLRSNIEQKENDIKLTNEQIQFIKSDIKRIEDSISSNNNKITLNNSEKTNIEAYVNGLNIKLLAKKQELVKKESEFSLLSEKLNESEQYIEDYNSKIINTIQKTSEIKGNINRIETLYNQLDLRKEEINTELEYITSQLKDKSVQKLVKEKEIEEAKDFINKEQEKIKTFTDLSYNLEKNLQQENLEINNLHRKINEASSRHKILQDLEKNNEGYFKSVKMVLTEKAKNPDKYSGILGPVGQLLHVNKDYETAIEVALSGYIQNIITKTEEDAKIAVNYLKLSNGGRATFLPLTSISPKNLGKQKEILLNEKGVIGIAKDLIEYEKVYENIFSNILDKVIVVNNIDNAIILHRKYKFAYKIVTLEGEVLNAGGSITGGSMAKNSSTLISRSREIKDLEEQLVILKSKGRILQEKINKEQEELEVLKLNLETSKSIINDKNMIMVTLNHNLEMIASLISQLEEDEKDFIAENTQLMIQITESNKQLRDMNKELEIAEQLITDTKNKLNDYQNNISSDRKVKDDNINEITNYKIEIGTLEQEHKNYLNNNTRINSENQILTKENEDNQNIIIVKLKEIENKNIKISEYESEIENLTLKQNQTVQTQENINSNKIHVSQNIIELEKEKENLSDTINLVKNELTRIELKTEQLEENSRKLYDTMWEEYNLTYQSALSYKTDGDIQVIIKEERALKSQIQSLGNINVDAIEEYKSVNERYTFLFNQRQDIISAEAKLVDLITDLVKLMEIQFAEQLKIISDNFAEVFTVMFGGGSAYLQLSNENDVLNSGIEIIAKPPGKTLQNMSLLSGGERALTATALIFGILRMKPSPFCILDEVEAALDDANVNRYANYLKTYCSDTQFILITHRKGTMEAADVLYGVTMQEQGVSKLVSVNFSNSN